MKLAYIMELLDNRTKGAPAKTVTYVEEDLYNMYDAALARQNKYEDVASKKPNLLFRNHIISPEWMRPPTPPTRPCCCHCCKGCC